MYHEIEFIIPCGGQSTRNYPHSKAIAHKSLMPFGDMRLIDFVLKDIIAIGGKHITIVCSNQEVIHQFKSALQTDEIVFEKLQKAGKTAIAEALNATFLPQDIDLKFVIQAQPLGTAHVLGIAHRVSPNRHGIMIFPDDIIVNTQTGESYLSQFAKDFVKNPNQILLTGIEQEDVSNVSIIHEGRLVEKPKNPSNFIGGFSPMAFSKEVLDFAVQKIEHFEKTGELKKSSVIAGEWIYPDLVNDFLDTVDSSYSLKMFIKESSFLLLDTGTLPLYEKAQLYALLKLSSFQKDNLEYVKKLLES